MIDIIKEIFENKTFEELEELNKMSGEPYIPENQKEFDEMMKCWLPESDVPEKYWKMENKTLHLSLKKEWFDMINCGEKKEEYRELKKFWLDRLFYYDENMKCYSFKPYDKVEFTLGYPKKDDMSKRMTFLIAELRIGDGIEKWGAKKGVDYIVIKLGERIYG